MATQLKKRKERPEQLIRKLQKLQTLIQHKQIMSPQSQVVKEIESHLKVLQALHVRYMEEAELSPGDLVVWKEGLQNRTLPRGSDPAIVIEVLAEPLAFSGEKDSGSPYFNDVLNLKLGVFVDNKFLFYYYDKNRFTKYAEGIS